MGSTLLLLVALLATTASVVRAEVAQECPKLLVVGPPGLTTPGEMAAFSIDLGPLERDNPKFKWEVSLGTIEDGQGTSKIAVRADKDP